MTDYPKITTYTSICVILLRELRIERGIHQAQVADWIGKSPSAWTKVEAGKSPLQFETFARVCLSFQVQPSTVMAAAVRYSQLLRQHQCVILIGTHNTDEVFGIQSAIKRNDREIIVGPALIERMLRR